MSQATHTYGPTCYLAQAVSFSGSKGDDDIPALKAQFFYASPLPIDDPLPAAPTPTGSDSKSIQHTARPFTAYDNSALEEAWLGLGSGKDKKRQQRSRSMSPNKEHRRYGRKKNDKSPSQHSSGESSPESCACEGSHSSCRNEQDKCKCPSCPQNPAFAGASNNAQICPELSSNPKASMSSKSSKKEKSSSHEKDLQICPELTSNPKDSKASKPFKEKSCSHEKEERAAKDPVHQAVGPPGDAQTSPDATSNAKDSKASKPSKKENPSGHAKAKSTTNASGQQSEERGSPHNTTYHDPHHVSKDSQVPSCCADMEVDDRMEHNTCDADSENNRPIDESSQDKDPKASKHGNGKSRGKRKADPEGVEGAQGDGADDGSTSMMSQGVSLESTSHECQPNSQNTPEKGAKVPEESSKKPSEKSGKAAMAETDTNILKSKTSRKKDNSGLSPHSSGAIPSNVVPQGGDAGTTGSPFVKLPSRTSSPQPSDQDGSACKPADEGLSNSAGNSRRSHERDSTETETIQVHGCKAHKNSKDCVDVPVGISRLHLVQLPALQMKPIYWSPVNDICAVTRGTWFYKDTMYPVEPHVANQLESGYRELRPWSQTWNDELNSAVEVGAAGEEKIAYRLWPKEEEQKRKPHKGSEHHPLSNDPYCAAICFHGEAAAEGTLDPDDSDKKASGPKAIVKRYSKSQVIYKDAQNAFILKSNLQPSAYYGRKPLQKIRKGTTVGIHVVRGFDWKTWEKLHPSKKSTASRKAEENAPITGNADTRKRNVCAACRAEEERCKVTDLIFVIHGIGQKLSESMESFHFTHAINSFRRSVNVELGNEAVQRVLRRDLGGVMVLPINWRSRVSFDEGGLMKDADKPGHRADFSMKDITPSTIPAVRDFIEKVMLDIPYWMSIHKPEMCQAVICEANRVYRLWCKNNPEFHKEGRVHIIAHSLGCAMALEILSKQPTSLSKLDLNSKKVNTKCFDFQTTNLFFCGSPAGFFLYLEKGSLIPRRGQSKPGAEHGDEQDKAIAGDVGIFGCMAVDNVYNIMHPEDPIAYQVNATVDPQYAASLKKAQVPSATTGFFESIGNAMRSITPGVSSTTDLPVGQVSKPAGMNRLPSQLEMEVHDFTREEIAEKKFYLLNDNGQMDYFLCPDSGPLSFQYINMLSAHSSYWESCDFVRLVVVEVGRKPGRSHCLPSMKAIKVRHRPQKGS
jgi:hypothetical protein